jgi:D-3-phosphoglycerate dehydrogenase
VILINCARGELYNEDALIEGLKSGKIAMAGIDVFSKEPATNHPLLDLPNVTVTAHLGANTVESQQKIAIQAATNAISAAKGISYPNALNLPIDESKIPSFVKPYLELSQRIGFLSAQTQKGAIKSIQIEAKGEIENYLDSILTFATVGALKVSMPEKVNYVNATFVADNLNIELKSSKTPNNSPYKNKITIKIVTETGASIVSGTIFNDDVQRIVSYNGFDLDIEPKGKMIFFRNSDVPGVIGAVGKTLGNNGINISDFRLGRNDDGALAVILVDEPISSNILEQLSNLDAAKSVSYAQI